MSERNDSSSESDNSHHEYFVYEVFGDDVTEFDPRIVQDEEKKTQPLPSDRVYDLVNKANAFKEARNGSLIIPDDIVSALALCGMVVLDGKKDP
jgi:hypothetical protein